MKVKIKKLVPEATIPKYAKPGDAGLDLTATSISIDEYGCISYGTGIAMEIPEGFLGLIFPRSSNCKKDLILTNSVGVIDSKYRGEIIAKFKPTEYFNIDDKPEEEMRIYDINDRICQIIIIPYPQIEFEEVEELSSEDRRGGFGSTGT